MMNHEKKKRSQSPKKKRSRRRSKSKQVKTNRNDEELNCLMEAFNSMSLDEVRLAYKQSYDDVNKAAEILCGSDDRVVSCSSEMSGSCSLSTPNSEIFGSSSGLGIRVDDRALSCSSEMSGSCSLSPLNSKIFGSSEMSGSCSLFPPNSEIFGSSSGLENKSGSVVGVVKAKPKKKTVSSSIGNMSLRDYYYLSSTKKGTGRCKYDVEKASTVLSASSTNHSASGRCAEDLYNITEDTGSVLESSNYFRDMTSDSAYHSSESELDTVSPMDYKSRSYVSALVGSEAPASVSAETSESELPRKVLESLFSTPKSSEHKPGTVNWRNVAKKMKPRGKSAQICTYDKERTHVHAKGDEYQVCREPARQHWDLKKSCYAEASTSYSKGERGYAAYMSEKGRTHNKIAREADEKASQDIFHLRNADNENVIAFDLHGQHVKPALEILKKNLIFGAIGGTVKALRVITGRGTHSMGKSKLKQSVINLLQEESIPWTEENPGVLYILLDGRTEFAFLDTYSDSELKIV